MQIIADLQLHSKYSRAVSKDMVVSEIARWARLKGIDLVATGDWTHPLWFRELQANLEEVEPGLFGLRGRPSPLFLLSTEVSCIYSQGGKLRRIHILIFAPSFSVAEKINQELRRRDVNLISDGRPIMGLTSRQVAELVLGVDERCLLIPAHSWTPHFSLYGSISGFDSIEECFGDYSKYIYAIETGLSSDPAMNWRIGELADRRIVSFSDAHSGAKLGREATVFELAEVSYENIRKAVVGEKWEVGSGKIDNEVGSENSNVTLQSPATGGAIPASHITPHISYTIEFYPEEGKYHYTGHRSCGVRQTPGETRKLGTICPVCGKKLTVGVMHRVEQLAEKYQISNIKNQNDNVKTRNDEYGVRWLYHPQDTRPPYVMMVPLLEILSEVLESGVSSRKVASEYEKLTQNFGSEFKVILQTKPEDIERVSGPRSKEAIMKVRAGDIFIDPGYDGVFGKVKIWPESKSEETETETETEKGQMGLF